jgi:putative ABC transport system substrate-binding protein
MRRYIAFAAMLLGAMLSGTAWAQQQQPMSQLGILAFSACPNQDPSSTLMKHLGELGYVEGRTIAVECILARGQFDRLPQLAEELVRRNVDVILTGGTPGIAAVQRATKTIPIVMWISADAVREGLVESLAHPGGNTTGNSEMTIELLGKRLELLHEIVPKLRKLAVLSRRGTLPQFIGPFMQDLNEAATAAGITVTVVAPKENLDALRGAFTAMEQDRPDALYVIENPFAYANAKVIADLAREHHLPTITGGIILAHEGALVAYGVDEEDSDRRAAIYIAKILRGAKPANLLVEQSTKFTLVINRATARALQLTIPQSILARADEVIE